MEHAANRIDLMWSDKAETFEDASDFTKNFRLYKSSLVAARNMEEDAIKEDQAALVGEQVSSWLALTVQHEGTATDQIQQLQRQSKQHGANAQDLVRTY